MRAVITILDLIACLALISTIILQSGKTSGLSGLTGGGGDTFLSRNKSKSFDSRLSRATKWIAGAFVLLTLVLHLV